MLSFVKPAELTRLPLQWAKTLTPASAAHLAMALTAALGLVRPPFIGGEAWAHTMGEFFLRSAQAGVDYVYMHSPWGFAMLPTYHPRLYWAHYAGNLGIAALGGYLYFRFLPRISSWAVKVAVTAAILLSPLFNDGVPAFLLMVSLFQALRSDTPRWSLVLPAFAYAAILSQTKFTFFLLSVAFIAFWIVGSLSRRRIGWQTWAPVLLYCSVIFLLWVAAGQSLANFPRYVRLFWEIGAGHADGMGLAGPWWHVGLALVWIGLCGAGFLASLRHDPRGLFRLAMAGMFVVGVFLEWKHGLLRHDEGHTVILFSYLALLPALCFWDQAPPRLPRLAAPLIAVALFGWIGLCGTHWNMSAREAWGSAGTRLYHRLRFVLRPETVRRDRHAQYVHQNSAIRLYDYEPIVKGHSIDANSPPGIAMVQASGMNYRPRPVFESYAAYTPLLSRLNRDFLESAHAPRFMLFLPYFAYDGHHPGHQEAGTLISLLRHYRPVAESGPSLLLERLGESPEPLSLQASDTRSLALGEWVDWPLAGGGLHTLSLEIEKTWLGRLYSMALRGAELHMDLVTRSGQKRSFRMVAALAREEFLMRPFLETSALLAAYYRGEPEDPVVRFRLHAPKPYGFAYRNRVRMTARVYSDPVLRRTNAPVPGNL